MKAKLTMRYNCVLEFSDMDYTPDEFAKAAIALKNGYAESMLRDSFEDCTGGKCYITDLTYEFKSVTD